MFNSFIFVMHQSSLQHRHLNDWVCRPTQDCISGMSQLRTLIHHIYHGQHRSVLDLVNLLHAYPCLCRLQFVQCHPAG